MRKIIGKILIAIGIAMIITILVYWAWSLDPSLGIAILGALVFIIGLILSDL